VSCGTATTACISSQLADSPRRKALNPSGRITPAVAHSQVASSVSAAALISDTPGDPAPSTRMTPRKMMIDYCQSFPFLGRRASLVAQCLYSATRSWSTVKLFIRSRLTRSSCVLHRDDHLHRTRPSSLSPVASLATPQRLAYHGKPKPSV
jgi:hypothetical protein